MSYGRAITFGQLERELAAGSGAAVNCDPAAVGPGDLLHHVEPDSEADQVGDTEFALRLVLADVPDAGGGDHDRQPAVLEQQQHQAVAQLDALRSCTSWARVSSG